MTDHVRNKVIIDTEQCWKIWYLKESIYMLGFNNLSRPSIEINNTWESLIKKENWVSITWLSRLKCLSGNSFYLTNLWVRSYKKKKNALHQKWTSVEWINRYKISCCINNRMRTAYLWIKDSVWNSQTWGIENSMTETQLRWGN